MEEFYELLDNDGVSKISAAPLSTHCNVPLKYSKQRAALLKPAQGQMVKPHNKCNREFRFMKRILHEIKPKSLDLCAIQEHLLEHILIPDQDLIKHEWAQQNRIGDQLWKLEFDSLKDVMNIPLNGATTDIPHGYKDILYTLYLRRCFFEEGVLMSASHCTTEGLWWNKNSDGICVAEFDNFKILAGEEIVVIRCLGFDYLISRDHLLILSDLAAQRYLLRKLSILDQNNLNHQFIPLGLLDELFRIHDQMLTRSGNRAYKLVYGLEPACVAELVGDIPTSTTKSTSFKENIIADQTTIAKSLNLEDLLQMRINLLKSSFEKNPNYITQIYGLYRLWGHPTLEPLEGAAALKKLATAVRGTNYGLAEEISNKFKEEFIIRYIARNNTWPNLNVSQLSPSNRIRQAYESKGQYPKFRRSYSRSSLSLVDFEKTFPVDPKFDIIEMIADKSMSLYTDELIQLLTLGKGVGSAIARSVLIQWMESPLHDPKEFLNGIDKYGFLPIEQSFAIREKEREGKIEARMFGLMTLIKRTYIVLTEALLAEHILQYFPEITMTDSELALEKKRFKFNESAKDSVKLTTSLDFSKWNTNMREGETIPLFKSIDQLFGFQNCYQRTHQVFDPAFVYLLNGSYIPTIKSGKFVPDVGSWFGHLGGIEGMRQKGWTIWTVILILLSAEQFPIKISILGQGDNQIIREVYPEEMEMDTSLNLHFQFIENLEYILSRIGPPLKLEETWTSSVLFIYGKYVMYRGVALSTSAKKMARIFRLANEDYPTIESAISSCSANFTAALAQSHSPSLLFPIYLSELVGLFQLFFRFQFLQPVSLNRIFSVPTSILIPHRVKTRSVHVPACLSSTQLQNDVFYIALLLMPKPLGGFPIVLLPNVLLRGFPDEVSLSISSLRLIYKRASSQIRTIIKKILCPLLHPSINYNLLLEHPTALNLDMPPSPVESRRNLIVDFLQSTKHVKNPYLKEFLTVLKYGKEQPLYDYLMDSVPCNPRVLSLIASSTIEARARHVAGKLQKTKTMALVAVKEGAKDLYSVIQRAEITHIGGILRLIYSQEPRPISWDITKCSVSHAMCLRDIGWKKKLVGLDCVPPLEFLYLEDITPISSCSSSLELDKGEIVIRFDQSLTSEELTNPLISGNFKPYRGSTTQQKVSGYGTSAALQADPLLKTSFRLFDLIGWAFPSGGNMSDLISNLTKTKTDLDLDQFIPDEDMLCGSVHHRAQDERTGHGGAVPILGNYGTKFVFDTFPLIAYSKGSKNINLMFQSLMSCATVLLSWALNDGWTPSSQTAHLHVKSSCCVRNVDEQFIDHHMPFDSSVLYKNVTSPYLFISKEKAEQALSSRHLFPVTLLKTEDKHINTNKLNNLLAEEIFSILQPHYWDKGNIVGHYSGLVINWTLHSDIRTVLELLSIRLISHFSGAMKHDSPVRFLYRIAERINRSPSSSWERLDTLIFAPHFHHCLTSAPYYSSVSGNPAMTPSVLAFNIKTMVITIIKSWAQNIGVDRLERLDFISRPFSGLLHHPSLLDLIRDWLLSDDIPYFMYRDYLISILIDKPVNISIDAVRETIMLRHKYGSSKICKDSLDVLCKKELIAIKPPTSLPTGNIPLPPGSVELLSLSSSDLVYTSTTILISGKWTKHGYLTHTLKPLLNPTSGPPKLVSMYSSHPLSPPSLCAVVGDGAGGYTLATLLQFPLVKVFYNTLLLNTDQIQQASPIPYIPALAGRPELESRVVNLKLTTDVLSDITSPDYPSMLESTFGRQIDALVCDAEQRDMEKGSYGLKLAKACVEIAKTQPVKWIIFKTYAVNASLLRMQISLFLNLFSHVSVRRSHFSTGGNTEVFLICTGPSNNFDLKSSGGSLIGHQLPIEFDDIISKMSSTIQYNIPPNQAELAETYLEYLYPQSLSHKIRVLNNLIGCLFTSSHFQFPHAVEDWFLATCMKHPGSPPTTHVYLETYKFTDQILYNVSLLWIVMWFWASFATPQLLETLLESGELIWYRTNSGQGSITVSLTPIPSQFQGLFCRAWSLKSIFSVARIKHMWRIIGMLEHYPTTPSYVSQLPNNPSRGGLTKYGRTMPVGMQPKNSWILNHLIPNIIVDEFSNLGGQPVRTLLPRWKQQLRSLKGGKRILDRLEQKISTNVLTPNTSRHPSANQPTD